MPLGAWLVTTGLTAAGIVALVVGALWHWGGAQLLIAPLLIALGVTSSAILAGLKNPWGILALFSGIIIAFVVIRYLNLFGLGPII